MIQEKLARMRTAQELLTDNRRFYDLLWAGADLIEAEHFNTWPLIQSLLPHNGRQLEVAPGLRPRLPIDGTTFADISAPALAALQARGAVVVLSQVNALPFADATFDLVCALDIIEHVENDEEALSELSRVAKSGAALIISTPLHPKRWNTFDDFVGHKRRYEPEQLLKKLTEQGLIVQRTGAFGMQPGSSRLLDLGMWWLTHHRERAMWWYNKVFMRLGLRLQSALEVYPGMIPTDAVDEILLVCRRADRNETVLG